MENVTSCVWKPFNKGKHSTNDISNVCPVSKDRSTEKVSSMPYALYWKPLRWKLKVNLCRGTVV